MNEPLHRLHELGQSIWYDDIRAELAVLGAEVLRWELATLLTGAALQALQRRGRRGGRVDTAALRTVHA